MSRVKLIKPTPAEDAEIAAGIAADPDTMEMSAAQFAEARMAKRSRGRPAGSVAESRKETVTLRLDPDLVEAMRASGPGWQTRCNQMLRREFLDREWSPYTQGSFHVNTNIEGVAASAAAVHAATGDAQRVVPRLYDMDGVVHVVDREVLDVTTSVSATVEDAKRSLTAAIDDVRRRLSTLGYPNQAEGVTESFKRTQRQLGQIEEAVESLKSHAEQRVNG